MVKTSTKEEGNHNREREGWMEGGKRTTRYVSRETREGQVLPNGMLGFRVVI